MPFELSVILTFLVSFFSALFVLPNLSIIARRIGLVDVPNERKIHRVPQPLVGGIGIVISATFSSLIFVPLGGMRGYFSGLALLLLVGFFDDFLEVGHRKKFLAQIIATSLLIYLSKVQLHTFGNLLGLGEIVVPGVSWITWSVTVFCVVGVTNAVNMIDGLDGLAGGFSFIAFIAFAVLASLSSNNTLMLLNLALAGAVLGFLKFNWSPSVLFMGDAGSLCLGFSLSFMAIALTQGEDAVISPIIVLLVLAVPIADTITVMIRRIFERKSPFKPDKTHLHHIFVSHGCSEKQAVRILLSLVMILSGIGILGVLFEFPECVLFAVFLLYFTLNFWADGFIRKLARIGRAFQRKEKPQNCPAIVHSLFKRMTSSRFFRGAHRYNVEMEITCSSYLSEFELNGTLLNISRTGFFANIDKLGFVCRECVVTISFPEKAGNQLVDIPVEHLWMSRRGEKQYHGFKFLDLEQDQANILHKFIDNLEKNRQ
jgi:UDP-GlcNAc:undecaprenyl-phosphate GlcNAc-1-phosphate transferase